MITQNAPADAFVPALVVLAVVGTVKLWREQSGARREDR